MTATARLSLMATLALTLALAVATTAGGVATAPPPPVDAVPAGVTADTAPTKPASQHAHRKSPCDRLDAASTPACADRLPKPPVTVRPAADPAATPPAAEKPGAAKPGSATPAPPKSGSPAASPAVHASKAHGAKHAAPPAHRRSADYWQLAVETVHKRPILAGGAGGGLILLLAAGVWSAAARLGHRPPAVEAPRATPPTAFRRDVVLKDEAGRDWRSAGSALTPGLVAGSGAGSELRLTGEGVAPRHLMLWVRDGRLLARRLADPVFLNDRLLKDATPEIVSTGDQLRLGRANFTLMID